MARPVDCGSKTTGGAKWRSIGSSRSFFGTWIWLECLPPSWSSPCPTEPLSHSLPRAVVLNKPVISVNITTYCHALRHRGIDDKIQDWTAAYARVRKKKVE